MRNNQTYNDSEFPQQLFTRAYTTSEFKELLVDVNTKLLTKGWNDCPVTYPEWCRSVEVPNFKQISLISISSFSKLEKINTETQQEITPGEFSVETTESFKLETYAKLFAVSERAYVNDDHDVIKNAPILMGASARNLLEETVFSVLLSNPVLADGIQLCHADHNNLISRCPKYHQS